MATPSKSGKQLLLVRISSKWLDLTVKKRETISDAILGTVEVPPEPQVAMGGNCEIVRWTDGDQICEQWVCYDPHGLILEAGPIRCRPIPIG